MPKRTVGYRLVWYGPEVMKALEAAISEAMAVTMLAAEKKARQRLYPGHGYDTGTMQRRTHVAQAGNNWRSEHVDPAPGTQDLGGKKVYPERSGPGGNLRLELGCGQNYTIFYHSKYDPFLKIAWEWARGALPDEIHRQAKARGF